MIRPESPPLINAEQLTFVKHPWKTLLCSQNLVKISIRNNLQTMFVDDNFIESFTADVPVGIFQNVWAVCTKVVLRPVRNKVHPLRKSGMECDIGFVLFDLVITMNPHFGKNTNLLYHHILIYLEAKWQSFFHIILYLTSYLFFSKVLTLLNFCFWLM